MILGAHGTIRLTEPDDAPAFQRIYAAAEPRAALLDTRREPVTPTLSELREVLAHKDAAAGVFFTVGDASGVTAGFGMLRGAQAEASFADVSLMMLEDAALESPLADEAIAFLLRRAFARGRLNKVVTHLLDTERALRAFYAARGFRSGGVQREALFARGRWYDLETLELFARDSAGAAPGATA